jgi:flagellar basal-body rod protein FlgG
MLYGLYLSATGVMTNSYRQDVIANNLANAQTVGFKKDLTLFKQRPTAAEESPAHADWTDPLMDKMGGGTFAMPIAVDTTQGELQHTGSNLDTAIDGDGYFAVDANGKQRLTRNGEFLIDRDGNLVLADGRGEKVLDPTGKPIQLDSSAANVTSIGQDGQITQAGKVINKIGMFSVPDPTSLKKEGGTLLSGPDISQLSPSNSTLRSEFLENANVDPATEMAALMDTQRQLEANANMIKYQDQTLDELVNTVGKIS